VEQENRIIEHINTHTKENIDTKFFQHIDKFSSLIMLEALINLLNKRQYIQYEFKKIDGYILLQHIFTSIASLNKFKLMTSSTETSVNHYYYNLIQKKLFVVMINGSFRKPVFSLNFYSNENIQMCFERPEIDDIAKKNDHGESKSRLNSYSNLDLDATKSSNIYIVNPDLLAQVIIEWSLWRPFTKNLQEQKINTPYLWQHIFKILYKLLEDSHSSQLYHSNLFLKYNILEKLIHFLLDANEENCLFDQSTSSSLIKIFKHFNSFGSDVSTTKQLFSNFFEYLHILHPENNAYIVYSPKIFYFNLTLSKFSLEFFENMGPAYLRLV